MKSFKYISIVLVALLTLVGCKDKMRELNTNADLVDDTQVIYMFTGATQNFDWSNVRGTANYMNSLHKVMQYRVYYNSKSSTAYRNPDLDGAVSPSYITGICYNELFDQQKGNRLYSILNYIDTNVPEADKAKYADVYAICRGLLAYMQWRVYENFGASIYTEAFKAISEGITQPHYDYIEDMWKVVDAEYEAAIKVLAAEPDENVVKLGTNDFFAGWKSVARSLAQDGGADLNALGDNDKQRAAWLRFFNLTRLEMAWKLRGVEPSHFSSVVSSCASYPIMESVEDGFYFNYAHDLCCEDDMQEPEQYHVVSDAFINFLVANKDPRLPYMARPTGATEKTSVTFNMMKEYFADSLAKYFYLDGKHPYQGISANPASADLTMEKQFASDPNPFITTWSKSFNKLANPKGTAEFKYECTIDGVDYSTVFCDKDKDEFNASILVTSENCNRYWVLCGGRHYADHAYGGNGIAGKGLASLSKLHGDGCSNDEKGQVGVATRCRVFTYAKQCFILASIGQNFKGKTPAQWYEEGVQAAFDEIIGEAARCRIQAWNGGDNYGRSCAYPSSLTQATPSGDWTITFPHQISQADIDAYIAAHPFSPENLQDQIYAYGFLDPYFAYINRRITGYPEFIEHETPEEAQAETHAYMEQPYNGDVELLFPRRGCLPDKNATNANFAEAKLHLLGMSGFGDWEETENGIWWEVPYMN